MRLRSSTRAGFSENPMHKNKSRQCQQALRLVEQALEIDREDEHALPGSAVSALKVAKAKLVQAIQVRKTRSEREEIRRGNWK